VAYGLGRKLFSERAGLIAAALTACNPLLIWYSQEARAYSLLVLVTGVAFLGFLYAREDPTPRRVGLWAVMAALSLATHYYALLAIVPEAAWLLVEHHRRRPVQVALAAVGVWGLALVPLALAQKRSGRGNWIAGAALSRRLRQVVPQFLTGFQLPGQSVLVPVAGALALVGLALLIRRGAPETRRRALWCVALALGGLVLNLLLIAGGIDDLLTRNLLALWLPAALVLVAGLSARRAGPIGVLATAGLCTIGVTSAVGVMANRDFQRPDWRGVARLLGDRPPLGGQRAIFIQHYRDLLPLSLYLPGLSFERHALRVRELDFVSFTSPPSGGFCWWGPGCNLWPSVMQASYTIPGFRTVSVRHVYQFTVLRMVADAPTRVSPHEISRALRTTRYRNDELLLQR
jgi:mannosyltransferase